MAAHTEKLERFYHSTEWKKLRRLKRMMGRGICEKCGKAGWEVHHVIHLTDENVDDPSIALNLDNLVLLCKRCHNAEHERFGAGTGREPRKDYFFDSDGNMHFKGQG